MISPRMFCIVLFLGVATIGFGQQKTKDKKNTATAHNKVKTKLLTRAIDINDTSVDKYNYDSNFYAIPYVNEGMQIEMHYQINDVEHVPLGTVLFHAAFQQNRVTYKTPLTADQLPTDTILKKDLPERYVSGMPDITIAEGTKPGVVTPIVPLKFHRPRKLNVMIDITMDKETHKPVNKILAVGPYVEIYGPDGVLRGKQTVFWLMYSDVQPIIASYEKTHPGCNVLAQIEDIEMGKKVKKGKK